jgi:hypothetical protein
MKAALLLMALLAGPAHHEMTAREATVAANREIHRVRPGFDLRRRTIRTGEEVGGVWSVYYESPDDLHGGGPTIVQVDKRTRRARIVQSPN